MTDPTAAFSKMVPGFDFLQSLVKGAGAAMPAVGQWIAPTLDPEELDKRISELRTVQFWLEQNTRLLAASIQALEVQRMTLSTLKTMNVSMSDLTESLKIRLPETAAAPTAAAAPFAASFAAPFAAPARSMFGATPVPPAEPPATPPAPEAPAVPSGAIDPMQWWGALTQQFSQLAASAMNDTTGDAARTMAGAMVKQGLDAAGDTFRKAATLPAAAAGAAGAASAAPPKAARAAAKTAAKTAATAPSAAPRRAATKPR